VLAEIEGVVRRKAPKELGTLALLCERANIEIITDPAGKTLTKFSKVIDHHEDARIIAVAWSSDIDYFVKLDQVHFLKNRKLRKLLHFPIRNPWVRVFTIYKFRWSDKSCFSLI